MESLSIRVPDPLKDFVPSKDLGISVCPYTVRDLNGSPSKQNWWWVQEKLKKLDYRFRVPSLEELIRVIRDFKAKPQYRVKADILRKKSEMSSDLICQPHPESETYSPKIEPRIQKGKEIFLIRGAVSGKRGGKKIFKGGERIELPEHFKESGELGVRIKELGLNLGDYIFHRPYRGRYEADEGLRALVIGNITSKKVGINATLSPFDPEHGVEYRFCMDKTIHGYGLNKIETVQHVTA
jgi:hypothetical protein